MGKSSTLNVGAGTFVLLGFAALAYAAGIPPFHAAWASESVTSANCKSSEPLSKVLTPSAVTGCVSHTETLLIGGNWGTVISGVASVRGVSISIRLVMLVSLFRISLLPRNRVNLMV